MPQLWIERPATQNFSIIQVVNFASFERTPGQSSGLGVSMTKALYESGKGQEPVISQFLFFSTGLAGCGLPACRLLSLGSLFSS